MRWLEPVYVFYGVPLAVRVLTFAIVARLRVPLRYVTALEDHPKMAVYVLACFRLACKFLLDEDPDMRDMTQHFRRRFRLYGGRLRAPDWFSLECEILDALEWSVVPRLDWRAIRRLSSLFEERCLRYRAPRREPMLS